MTSLDDVLFGAAHKYMPVPYDYTVECKLCGEHVHVDERESHIRQMHFHEVVK